MCTRLASVAIASIAVIAFAVSFASPARAQCAADSIALCNALDVSTDAARTLSANPCLVGGGQGIAEGGYDLFTAKLHVNADGRLATGMTEVRVNTNDQFILTGPAYGYPVSITVRFTVVGSGTAGPTSSAVCSGSMGTAALRVGGVILSTGFVAGPPTVCASNGFSSTLALPMSKQVNQPFNVSLMTFASAGDRQQASASGVLTFTGLPQGYGVMSCQGFDEVASPTARLSWGELKVIYR